MFEITVIQPSGTVEVIRACARPSFTWLDQLGRGKAKRLPGLDRYGPRGAAWYHVPGELNIDASALALVHNSISPTEAIISGPVIIVTQVPAEGRGR